MEKIYGIIPVGFFRNSSLSIFNGELLNGGAFRLRAVGSDIDGNPLRSKSYMFFTNGMYSMVALSQEAEREVVGYEYIFTRRKNNSSQNYYWEVRLTKNEEKVSKAQKRLTVSNERPTSGIIISEVESRGGVSQYFYIT